MKKRISLKISLLAVLILICGMMLTACSTSASKAATFDVDTGDRIKVSVNTKNGLDLTMQVPFTITKDDSTIITGSFTYAEYYDVYRQVVEDDSNIELLEEGNRDGNDYFLYTLEGNAGTEYDFIVMVKDSKTAVIMGSLAEKEEAVAAFEAITISLE